MVDLSDGPFEYSVNNVVFVVPGIVVVGLAARVLPISRTRVMVFLIRMWMTLASGLQVAAAEVPGASVEDNVAPTAVPDFDKELPTPAQLLEMLDAMTGLSEEEKNSIKQELLGNLRVDSPQSLGGNDMTTQTVVLLSLLGVIALIFEVCYIGEIMEIVMNALKSKGVMTEDLEEKLSGLMSDEAKERLSGIFEKYRLLSDEEKEEFVGTVFGKLRESLQERTEAEAELSVLQSHSYTIFFGAVFLITLVIVFFVYKLFKCLSEREAKREEKKKQKQLKKKK